MVKFTADQLLIRSNLKCLYSSGVILYKIIRTWSHFGKCLCTRVEVDSEDLPFVLPEDGFNLSYFNCWVKSVTLIEVIFSSRPDWLTICKRETNYKSAIELNLSDSQISEFLGTLLGKSWHFWSTHSAFNFNNCFCSDVSFAFDDRIEWNILCNEMQCSGRWNLSLLHLSGGKFDALQSK